MLTKLTVLLLYLCVALEVTSCAELTIDQNDVMILVDEEKKITLELSGFNSSQSLTVSLMAEHPDLIDVSPSTVVFQPAQTKATVTLRGKAPGHVLVNSTAQAPAVVAVDAAYVRVTIAHSYEWDLVSVIMGWVYFAAWSISFYPQMYDNWKRKSVVGLNFDFLALNLLGFALYSLFNVGLFWIPTVQEQYFERHPRGLNPVQYNDIFFALHAFLAVVLTIIQCFIYERAEQSMSWLSKGLYIIYSLFLIISVIIASVQVIQWLDFLYYCSYVKLSITLIKYVPQAYMNYRRKSTKGWSIGNIFLDFTGGVLSMLQMIVNSYNFNDWQSIFGDPTKFGLGLFSVVFDVFFFIQHYGFYRSSTYAEVQDSATSFGGGNNSNRDLVSNSDESVSVLRIQKRNDDESDATGQTLKPDMSHSLNPNTKILQSGNRKSYDSLSHNRTEMPT